MVDCELVLPEEDEVSAALRLLARVLKEHPRCFDVLSADAIYAPWPTSSFSPSSRGRKKLLARRGKRSSG